jgi:hypothetical protein
VSRGVVKGMNEAYAVSCDFWIKSKLKKRLEMHKILRTRYQNNSEYGGRRQFYSRDPWQVVARSEA